MDPDLVMVIGIVVGGLTIPSIMGAFAEGRVPRAAAIAVVISGGLIVLAMRAKPGGYVFADIPDIFVNVVGRYLN